MKVETMIRSGLLFVAVVAVGCDEAGEGESGDGTYSLASAGEDAEAFDLAGADGLNEQAAQQANAEQRTTTPNLQECGWLHVIGGQSVSNTGCSFGTAVSASCFNNQSSDRLSSIAVSEQGVFNAPDHGEDWDNLTTSGSAHCAYDSTSHHTGKATIALCCDESPSSSEPKMDDCEWRAKSSTSSLARSECLSDQVAVFGGCDVKAVFSSAEEYEKAAATLSTPTLVNSNIYENGSGSNLPDQNEDWDNIDGTTGWFCDWAGGSGSFQYKSYVLCCDDPS